MKGPPAKSGVANGVRTRNLLGHSQALCLLSYGHRLCEILAIPVGDGKDFKAGM